MSLHDRPSVMELLIAVREYLHDEVAAASTDRRARFRALIAANVVSIVERELVSRPTMEEAERLRLAALLLPGNDPLAQRVVLGKRIRAGHADEEPYRSAVFAYAKAAVAAKLQVANPTYLARFEKI